MIKFIVVYPIYKFKMYTQNVILKCGTFLVIYGIIIVINKYE